MHYLQLYIFPLFWCYLPLLFHVVMIRVIWLTNLLTYLVSGLGRGSSFYKLLLMRQPLDSSVRISEGGKFNAKDSPLSMVLDVFL